MKIANDFEVTSTTKDYPVDSIHADSISRPIYGVWSSCKYAYPIQIRSPKLDRNTHFHQ